MSLVAPVQRRPWIAVAAGLTLLIAVVTTLVLVDLPGRHILSGRDDAPAVQEAVPQAPWTIKAYPAGVTAKVTKAQEKVLAKRRPEVIALVKRVYDSLFLHPGRLDGTLEENFTQAAATALKRSGAGVAEAGAAATTLRTARIGLQASGGARLAIASVTVRAARPDADAAPLRHKATLWMQRANGGWKVVAFDVDQGPIPELGGQNAGEAKGDGKRKGKRK